MDRQLVLPIDPGKSRKQDYWKYFPKKSGDSLRSCFFDSEERMELDECKENSKSSVRCYVYNRKIKLHG